MPLIVNTSSSLVPSTTKETTTTALILQQDSTTTSSSSPSLLQRISRIAKAVFKFTSCLSIGTLLYWTNPSICALGFIIGIINHNNQITNAINKIKAVWDTQPWKLSALSPIALLSLPVTLAVSSFFFAARLGEYMSSEAQKMLNLPEQQLATN